MQDAAMNDNYLRFKIVIYGMATPPESHMFGNAQLEERNKRFNIVISDLCEVGLSIIASYPLMFSGLREAVVDLMKQGSIRSTVRNEPWEPYPMTLERRNNPQQVLHATHTLL